MFFRCLLIMVAIVFAEGAPAHSFEFHNIQLESQVEALFVGNREMVENKQSIERMVEPSVDVAANLKIIDKMAADLEGMGAEACATGNFDKLAALRHYIYETGPWNDGKAFSYDLVDPLGRKPENRLVMFPALEFSDAAPDQSDGLRP